MSDVRTVVVKVTIDEWEDCITGQRNILIKRGLPYDEDPGMWYVDPLDRLAGRDVTEYNGMDMMHARWPLRLICVSPEGKTFGHLTMQGYVFATRPEQLVARSGLPVEEIVRRDARIHRGCWLGWVVGSPKSEAEGTRGRPRKPMAAQWKYAGLT